MIRPVPEPAIRARVAAACMAAAVLALSAASAWGNMAAPPPPRTVHAGSRLGEPVGGPRDVFIEHETLRMDLRPLARARPARVEALYRVRNDGAARALDLLFVANGLADGATGVAIDGKPVAAARGAAALPPGWRAPATTPPLATADTTPLPYQPRGEGTLSFRVALPAGRHEIRVRYAAEASAYQQNDLTPIWQLGYVLAPARDWAGFGALDVRVRVPRGWAARGTLPLRRDGDELAGTFRGVPADALALSVQQPEPSAGGWYLLWLALAGAVLALCAAGAWRVGAALGRRGRSSAWALPASAAMTVAWTAAAALAFSAIPTLVAWRAGAYVGEYAVRSLGYGSTILLVLLVPVMLVFGLALLQSAAFRGRRRALARGS